MELVDSLAALAHPHRMRIFRLLMRRYPDSLPSGEIAQTLGLPANSTSTYLGSLKSAGLVQAARAGNSVAYGIHREGTAQAMTDLMGDCCRGRPDMCNLPHVASQRTLPMTPHTPFNVLFICTGNSARSIMAEAVMNHESAGTFRAYSAGTIPQPDINPFVRKLLQDKGIPTDGLHAKQTDVFTTPDAPHFDFVFTVCDHAANEECPVWPGQPMTAHWGMPDPAKVDGSDAERRLAFQQAYGLIRNRLGAFRSLPFDTLSRLSLQHEVDGIGQMQVPTAQDTPA